MSDAMQSNSSNKKRKRSIESSTNESEALKAILGTKDSTSSFLANIYQTRAEVYRNTQTNKDNEIHDKEDIQSSALNNVLKMGNDGLADILEKSRCLFFPSCPISSLSDNKITISPPLIFQQQIPLEPAEIQTQYNSNPFAAYLDGCSIVQNHAQLISPTFYEFTLDLQKTFPHVFINTYLTPPDSQAVSAHADDRDVFVLQLLGKKHWKVYKKVPIPHPYPEEQVGKYPHLPVSSDVFQSGTYLDIILSPGDVLYLPRGWVHEADTNVSSNQKEMSYHATIALATHDWTLARMATEEFQNCVQSIPSLRLALHPSLAKKNRNTPLDEKQDVDTSTLESFSTLQTDLEQNIEDMINIAKRHITARLITFKYHQKCQIHNQQMKDMYEHLSPLLSKYKHQYFTYHDDSPSISNPQISNAYNKIVGRNAANQITLTSKIRISSKEERASVPSTMDANGSPRPSGVSVAQNEICSTLFFMLSKLKEASPQTNKIQVRDLFSLCPHGLDGCHPTCDLFSLLSFVKCCVELGALALSSL